MWTKYIVESTEYTYQLSSWNLKKRMDSKAKINRGQETPYRSDCTKFDEFILIHETVNGMQNKTISIAPFDYFGRGKS